jgi:WD40 repeat protein
LWDTATGKPIGYPLEAGMPEGDNRPLDLTFSPDGGKLAAAISSQPGIGGVAVVWSVPDGKELYRLETIDDDYGRGSAVAFSPDGRLLATGGGSGEIKLWNAETGKRDGASLTAVAGWVTGMQFDPTGRLLAATGDGTIRVWDVERRAPFGSPVPAFPSMSDLRFTPDGTAIVEVYETGEGLIWPMSPDIWKKRACAVAGRTLSEREWQLYLRGRPYAPSCAATASGAPAR